jgi:hypothetical protein
MHTGYVVYFLHYTEYNYGNGSQRLLSYILLNVYHNKKFQNTISWLPHTQVLSSNILIENHNYTKDAKGGCTREWGGGCRTAAFLSSSNKNFKNIDFAHTITSNALSHLPFTKISH